MVIDAGFALTAQGNVTNNGTFTIESTSLSNNGSLIVYGTSNGTGSVTYNRYVGTGLWYILSSPVNGADLNDFRSSLNYDASTYDFGPYIEDNNYGWDYQLKSVSSFPLNWGQGYATRLITGTNVPFKGNLNGIGSNIIQHAQITVGML
jgi:hypothetical protein